MVDPPVYYAIHIHASRDRHNSLDLDSASKDTFGPPPPRLTFDRER
jgi:hypothetical protein